MMQMSAQLFPLILSLSKDRAGANCSCFDKLSTSGLG